MKLGILCITFFVLMTFGYGLLSLYQVELPLMYRFIMSAIGLIIANIIAIEIVKGAKLKGEQ